MKSNKKPNVVPQKTTNIISAKSKVNKRQNHTTSTLFDLIENHLNKKQNTYIIIIVLIAMILSIFCFDVKISLANDDALYIESGAKYAKDFFAKESFYLANAPLYPTLLGIIIKIFGVNVIVLKAFSILLFCSGIYMLFLAFRNRIPFIILFPSLLLTAINFQFLIYASLTYTECLYLFIIGVCFYIIFKCYDKIINNDIVVFNKNNIFYSILCGATGFLFLITRNIAIVAIIPIVSFLIYRKKYKESIITSFTFICSYFFYRLLIKLIWHIDQSQYEGQKLIFQKDAYNPALGMETTSGYITRLIENAQIYISQRFMYVLGFRPSEVTENNVIITVLFIGLLTWSILLSIKNKQYILGFTSVFFCTLLGANFIALQTSWGQTRFIMIYLPLILMSLFYIAYYYGNKYSSLQFVYISLFLILFLTSTKSTLSNIKDRFPVLVENIKGDPTYGYTPDWQNYIKMTKWCAQQFPNDTKSIAVRKAPMSYIFSAGKEFYGIYGTPTQNADSLLLPLRKSKVNYIMLAELRANPDLYVEGQIIGTMHRYAYYIQQKYPEAFQFVHQEGDLEKSQLYSIKWNYIDSLQKTLK